MEPMVRLREVEAVQLAVRELRILRGAPTERSQVEAVEEERKSASSPRYR